MAEGAQFSKEFAEKIEEEAFKSFRTLSDEELKKRFRFQSMVLDDNLHQLEMLRSMFRDLAWYIDNYIPNGSDGARARAIALTELESSSHWAVKALSQELAANEQQGEEKTPDEPKDAPSG